MIPVQAEDFERAKRRKVFLICGAALVVLLAAFYGWKLRSDPVAARQAFDAGERLFRAQRYNEAAVSLSQTIGRDSGFLEAYFLRGQAYANLFMWDRAIADFTTLAEKNPRDARAYRHRGLCWVERRNLDRALADASKAIECDPKMTDAYNLRGMVERQQGNLAAAMRDFDKAIEIQPSADGYTQRGSLWMEMGEPGKAEADYTAVMAFLPDASHPYYARAGARRALGNETGARDDNDRAKRIEGRR